MKYAIISLWAVMLIIFHAGPGLSADNDVLSKDCRELLRLAEIYQEDLKTVDTVLGAALDSGSIERIKSYKLKKGAVRKQLEAVLQAVDLRGCVKNR
jgi:hypothetical protein